MEGRLGAGIHPAVVFAAAAAFAASRMDAYGLTFDEARIADDARIFLQWILGQVGTREAWFGVERPSPAKILAAVGMVLGLEMPAALRLLPSLLYAAAVSVVYATLRRPAGAGAWAAVSFLVLAPPFSGYAAQCSNELVATSFLLLALCRAAVARTRTEWAWAGAWLGLAVGTKISGLVGVLALAAWAWRGAPPGGTARRGLGWAALGCAAGFLATWPALPLMPRAAFDHVAHFATVARPPLVHFGLRDLAPWYYGPFWIGVGLPSLLVLGAAWELARARGPWHALMSWYCGLGLAVSVAAAPVLREGVRSLLPLAAGLAICGGLGLARMAGAMRPGASRSRGALAALVALAASLPSTLAIHPAETGYVSALAGGPSGAASLGLPITSSGDVLNDEVWAGVPPGLVAVLPGPAADRPIYFGSPSWRRKAAAMIAARTGRAIRLVPVEQAERIVVIGPSRGAFSAQGMLGRPLLERRGVVYVSWLPHPRNLPLGEMEPGELEGRLRAVWGLPEALENRAPSPDQRPIAPKSP